MHGWQLTGGVNRTEIPEIPKISILFTTCQLDGILLRGVGIAILPELRYVESQHQILGFREAEYFKILILSYFYPVTSLRQFCKYTRSYKRVYRGNLTALDRQVRMVIVSLKRFRFLASRIPNECLLILHFCAY